MNNDEMDNDPINVSEASDVKGAHARSTDNGDTPDHPLNRKMTKRNNEEEDVLTEETSKRSPGDKITSKILKNGAMNKKLDEREYDKPQNDDNASENKDEEKLDYRQDTGVDDNSIKSGGNDEEHIEGVDASTHHKSMCERWFLKKFLVLKNRIKRLEDMALKQQKETKGVSRFELEPTNGNIKPTDKVPTITEPSQELLRGFIFPHQDKILTRSRWSTTSRSRW
jgi:hypothetical protein